MGRYPLFFSTNVLKEGQMAKTTLEKCPCGKGDLHFRYGADGVLLHGVGFFAVKSGMETLDALIEVGMIYPSEREDLVAELQASGLPITNQAEEEDILEFAVQSFSFVSPSVLDEAMDEGRSLRHITPEQEATIRERIAMRTEDEKITDGISVLAEFALSDPDREEFMSEVEADLLDRIVAGAKEARANDPLARLSCLGVNGKVIQL
jgi:hypothetical protein